MLIVPWELHDLGQHRSVHDKFGNLEKAHSVSRGSSSYQETLGEKNSEVGVTLDNMEAVHDKFGNLEKARQCHEEALAIKKALGEKHSEAGVTLDNIEAVHKSV